MVSSEKRMAISLPMAGPAAIPRLPAIPRIPIASPRRSYGTTSATYAAVPVGLKPVEKPCTRRRSMKAVILPNTGYKNPTKKHTKAPNIITGILPIVSASLPLNGRDKPAVIVKTDMISPLYSPPPKFSR